MNYILIVCLLSVSVGQLWADTCEMGVTERKDCGDVKTTPDGCVAKGCCWNVTTVPNEPNCFYKKGGPGPDPTSGPTSGPAPGGKRVFIHMMPWFETKASGGGKWGIHWTMANQNPDIVSGGKRQIASHYHPLIDAYASGDTRVIDWQLGLMKLSGVTGILVDWPGTSGLLDYGANMRNAEAIIARTAAHGLEFAIVYEDHNLELAKIPDHVGQAKKDMQYINDRYFSQSNHAKLNGRPLLMDFGPQTLNGDEWNQAFTPFTNKPEFLILWYQTKTTAGASHGDFAWPSQDWISGLQGWYNKQTGTKVGCAYSGFNSFYKEGGWGDFPWSIPVSVANFQQSLDLGLAHTDTLQVATWNDYGEGTQIEPTLEFEYQFLEVLQKKMGVSSTVADLKKVTDTYFHRVKYADNATMSALLEKQHFDLVHKYD